MAGTDDHDGAESVITMRRNERSRWPGILNTDDWSLVPVLTGAQPVTVSWLWSQHTVHRILVPRVLFLALYNPMMGYDFRSGVVFNALVLSILALAMIVVVKRLRGWTT